MACQLPTLQSQVALILSSIIDTIIYTGSIPCVQTRTVPLVQKEGPHDLASPVESHIVGDLKRCMSLVQAPDGQTFSSYGKAKEHWQALGETPLRQALTDTGKSSRRVARLPEGWEVKAIHKDIGNGQGQVCIARYHLFSCFQACWCRNISSWHICAFDTPTMELKQGLIQLYTAMTLFLWARQ